MWGRDPGTPVWGQAALKKSLIEREYVDVISMLLRRQFAYGEECKKAVCLCVCSRVYMYACLCVCVQYGHMSIHTSVCLRLYVCVQCLWECVGRSAYAWVGVGRNIFATVT